MYRSFFPSLARSVPKPLKVPSLARSVPKPLKMPSLARSVAKPLKVPSLARSVPKPLLIELREAGGHQPGQGPRKVNIMDYIMRNLYYETSILFTIL